MQLKRPASPKSTGWADRLETQGEADLVVEVQKLSAV